MKNITYILTGIMVLSFSACKNRDINEGEAFKPREIHEDIIFHFDKITVDGIEYLILEKDNNNPHEGFGFMAFRANKLMEKQDTLMAYVKAIHDLQIKTLAAASRRNVDEVREEAEELLIDYIKIERADHEILRQNNLSNSKISPGDSSEATEN
ncbi:MAG: hypothetical protein RIC53_07630 [Cyclobacteriaceae bacterium]